MSEQRLARLQRAVGDQFDAIKVEKGEELLRRQTAEEQLNKLVAEWEYLMSPELIAALRQAGSILSIVSTSDIHIYTTRRPDLGDGYERGSFFGDPSSRLHWKPQLSLIWDIKTEDMQGKRLYSMEWKEITVNARKDQDGKPDGYVFSSQAGDIKTDSSEDSIYDALDQVCLTPRRGLGIPDHKQYEVFRIRYQSLGITNKKWGEVSEDFRPRLQPERQLTVR